MNGSSAVAGGRGTVTSERAFVVTVAALVLFGVLAPLAYLRQPLHVDEAMFLVIGRELTEGATLYVDVIDHKPPAVFYVVVTLSKLPVETYVAGRLLVGAVHLVSTGLVFVLGRRLHTRWTGLFAAGGYLAGAHMPHFDGRFLLTEPFCVLALLVATLALFADRRGSNVLAGVALAVGVLFNQTVFLAGLVVLGFSALRLRWPENRTRGYPRRTLRAYVAIGSGFVGTLGAVALGFAGMGSLDDLLRFGFLVPLSSYETPFVLKGHLIAAASYSPVWLFAVGTALVVFYRLAAGTLVDERLLFLTLWLVVLGYPGATGFKGDHKLLLVMPAAALLAAYGVTVLARSFVDEGIVATPTEPSYVVAGIGLIVALTVVSTVGINAVYLSLIADDSVRDQIESAEAIDERIDGAVYTFPFNPHIVYFADGLEPARTFLATPYSPVLVDRVISDLERNRTPYVVVPEGHMAGDGTSERHKGFFPEYRAEVVEYFEANYERTGTAGGYVIYERTGGER